MIIVAYRQKRSKLPACQTARLDLVCPVELGIAAWHTGGIMSCIVKNLDDLRKKSALFGTVLIQSAWKIAKPGLDRFGNAIVDRLLVE